MFQTLPIQSITIHREDRQRRALDKIDDLADSISRLGLINPITIDENNILIAGERRLEACRRLGWTHISVQLFSDLPPTQRVLIELEENIKRLDISWQEHTAAIAKYHELRKEEDPTWNDTKTAGAIGMSQQNVTKHLTVARELSSPAVSASPTFSTAIERAKSEARKRDDLIHTYASCVDTHQIIHGDFLEWASTPQEKFNFIHCDFPYGINATGAAGQRAREWVQYADSPDTYWKLFNALAGNLDNFCAPDAHIIFWFSPNLYCNTWEMLKLLDGFTFEEHPLIWYRGISNGIAPDPYRRPRRSYEMAFFGWRGEARINKIKENLFYADTHRTSESHPSEKSQEMLEHFFSMVVDSHTRLLDPTCGSASSLRAAKRLGASTVLGIEANKEFADVARRALLDAERDLSAPLNSDGS